MALSLGLLGGEQREIVAANALLKKGYALKIFGLPKEQLIKEEAAAESAFSAVKNADVLLLPVKGVDEKGVVFAPWAEEKIMLNTPLLQSLKPKASVLCGISSPYLEKRCAAYGFSLRALMEEDAVAIPNAVPTAEGALALAIEGTPKTIKGARVVILGFGRVGRSCAKLFRAVNAVVTVVSRNLQEIEEGRQMGYDMRQYSGLSALLPHSEVVINTVPAPVLNRDTLAFLQRGAFVIDLASLPGGVDFAAAKEMPIKVVHALGLPNRYAPYSAGLYYAQGIEAVLRQAKEGRSFYGAEG